MGGSGELLGWHFLRADGRLDRRYRGVTRVGDTYRIRGPVSCLEGGFHVSEQVIDALQYAPGPIVCRVRAGGKILNCGEKWAASEMTVVWMGDVSAILHRYAAECAERVIGQAREHGLKFDDRLCKAVRVKRKWVSREKTDADLICAREDAERVAWSVQREAERAIRGGIYEAWDRVSATVEAMAVAAAYAAWAAVYAAEVDAVFAAKSAAESAVWATAWLAWEPNRVPGGSDPCAAAGNAEIKWQVQRLEKLLLALSPE